MRSGATGPSAHQSDDGDGAFADAGFPARSVKARYAPSRKSIRMRPPIDDYAQYGHAAQVNVDGDRCLGEALMKRLVMK